MNLMNMGDAMLSLYRKAKLTSAPLEMPKTRSHQGVKTEATLRRLAKYSKYNKSEKGRARVERYRATPYIARGLMMGTKGMQNRETSYMRRLDKRIAAGEQTLREMLDAYNAKLKDPLASYQEPAWEPRRKAKS